MKLEVGMYVRTKGGFTKEQFSSMEYKVGE